MNKLVGILLGLAASVINLLTGTTILAFTLDPRVGNGFVEQVTLLIVEIADTMGAIGRLAAIEGSATQQSGEFCQGHAIHLMVHDVVNALLTVRDQVSQSSIKPFHNLTQKDTRLAEGIEELRIGTAKQLLRKHIQHLVGQHRRRKHLIVAQVGDAVEHIGIVFTIRHKKSD